MATSSKSGARQFPLVLGSSSGGQSTTSSAATVGGHKALADSGDTNSAYLLPAQSTHPSVNKLPNSRSRIIPAAPGARRALFQEPENQDQT